MQTGVLRQSSQSSANALGNCTKLLQKRPRPIAAILYVIGPSPHYTGLKCAIVFQCFQKVKPHAAS